MALLSLSEMIRTTQKLYKILQNLWKSAEAIRGHDCPACLLFQAYAGC
jgi:hypothetical protein